jgi:oxamate amidohydrolase
VTVTENQSICTAEKLNGLVNVPGFADAFLNGRKSPPAGSILKFEALADTLESLGKSGLSSYYDGDIAARHAAWLEENGSPLRLADFRAYETEIVELLSVRVKEGTVFNLPPPTQGVSSLMILGLFDRLEALDVDGFGHVHGLVEATKQAFIVRNLHLGDPATMTEDPADWLASSALDRMAERIDIARATNWPHDPADGDTIWMGAADRYGNVVSFIQSVYWEFGSGLTCPETGVFFQNRGAGFSLEPGPNQLQPGKRPFHTLNPAMAYLNDGRIMAYGTMGGEGQPQTQAAIFTRYARYGIPLQEAITAPRWLLGRTWGDDSTNLKIENRFPPSLVEALRSAGHSVQLIEGYSDLCGHAGSVVAHLDGLREGATDPRSDGLAI